MKKYTLKQVGISQQELDIIEKHLSSWKSSGIACEKYSYYIWVRLGNELKREPLLLAMSYLKYISGGANAKWISATESLPPENGQYFWRGGGGCGGYDYFDTRNGFDFPENIAKNETQNERLEWLLEI